MHAGQRADARDAPAGAHDDPAVDLLAEDRVRAADVAGPLGGDRGGLDAKATFAERRRRLVHHLVAGLAAVGEGEIEVALHHLEADHVAQLLAGLVAVQNRYRGDGHQPNDMGRLPGQSDGRQRLPPGAGVQPPSATIDKA